VPPPAGAQGSLDDLYNSIHQQESGGGKNTATSSTGAVGDMQIEPGTWAQYALPGENINNPADNMAVGKRIIADLYQRSGGDPARTAVGYVSGPGNMSAPSEALPYKNNPGVGAGDKRVSDYVSDVTGGSNAFADLIPPAPAEQNPFADLIPPPAPEQPGALQLGLQGLERGIGEAATGVEQTLTGPFSAHPQQVQQANDALQQKLQEPFSFSKLFDPSWLTAHIGYQLGSSSPAVGGAILGTVGAAVTGNPEAAIVTAPLGAAGGQALSELATNYQRAIGEGLSHDDAVSRAIKETGIDATVAGVMGALPGGKFLGNWAENTLRRSVSEAMINIFGTAPAANVAGQVAHAAIENKPLTMDDLIQGYVQGAITGVPFEAVHLGLGALMPGQEAPAPESKPIAAPAPEAAPENLANVNPQEAANIRIEPQEGAIGRNEAQEGATAALRTEPAPAIKPASPEAPATETRGPAIGDRVQVNLNGAYQFREPVPLRDIQVGPDGKQYGFVEGSKTGIPLDQIEVVTKGIQPDLGNNAAPKPEPTLGKPLPAAVGMPAPIKGTGEVKTRGLAESVEASAVQKELTEDFGDLPGYKVLNDPGQGAAALQLLQSDPDRARAVAMGDARPPRGVLQSAVFVAVKRQAEQVGDVDTLRSLATQSKFLSSVTRLGQEVSYLRNVADSPTDSVKAMVDLQKSMDQQAVMKNLQPKIDRQTEDAQNMVNKNRPPVGQGEWSQFLESIVC
jgi:hypothetical protein